MKPENPVRGLSDTDQGLAPDNGGVDHIALSEEELRDLAKVGHFVEWKIRAQMGIYPPDHPVTQYARALSRKANNTPADQEETVTVYRGVPNAFVFSSGSKYVSDQLLQMAEYEEELFFVMRHENQHFEREHHAKMVEIMRRSQEDTKPRDSIFQVYSSVVSEGLGTARFQEWESDIRSFLELDREGINPEGGRIILKKLHAKNPSGGMVHGSALDRALNMELVKQIKDLQSIDKPLTPIPQEIHNAVEFVNKTDAYRSAYQALLQHVTRLDHFKSIEIIQSMELPRLIVSLPDIVAMSLREARLSRREGDKFDQGARLMKLFIPHVTKGIWDSLARQLQADGTAMSTQQLTFFYNTVIRLCVDTEDIAFGVSKDTSKLTEDDLYGQSLKVNDPRTNIEIPWERKRFSIESMSRALEDLEEFEKLLQPTVFERLNIVLSEDPHPIIRRFMTRGLNQGWFEADDGSIDNTLYLQHCLQLTGKFNALYDNIGSFTFDTADSYRRLVNIRANAIQDPNNRKRFIRQAKSFYPDAFQVKKKNGVPESNEQEDSIEELFRMYSEFSAAYKSTGSSETESLVDSYKGKMKEFVAKQNFHSGQEITMFLGRFRLRLASDAKVWDEYFSVDQHWSGLVIGAIENLPKIAYSDAKTAVLNKLKDRVLLSYSFDNSTTTVFMWKDLTDFINKTKETIPLEWLRKLHAICYDHKEIGKELGLDISTPTINETRDRSEVEPPIKVAIYKYLSQIVSTSDKGAFLEALQTCTNEFLYDHSADPENMSGKYHQVKWQFIKEALEKYNFDFADINDLRGLYYLSTYFDSPSVAIRFQDIIWEKIAAVSNFDEGFKFLTDELTARRLKSFTAITNFIETRAKTHEEIEKSASQLEYVLTQSKTMENIGALVVAEEVATTFFAHDKLGLLEAIIGNGVNDGMLKSWVYKRWVAMMDSGFGAEKDVAEEVKPDAILDRLYKLDAQSKYVLIRYLLTSEDGVLTGDTQKRTDFIDFFVNNFITAENDTDRQYVKVIKEVLSQLVKQADYEQLYMIIAPILQDRVLQRPNKKTPWREIVIKELPPKKYQSYEFNELGKQRNDIRYEYEQALYVIELYEGIRNALNITVQDYKEALEKKQELEDKWGALLENPEPTEYALNKNEEKEILKLVEGRVRSDRDNISKVRNYEVLVEALLGNYEKKPEKMKMTASEFLLEIVQRFGAPGKRFLQIAGQYIPMPQESEQTFSAVYDKMSGQSKSTAHQTLVREWTDARQILSGLEERIGGGSLLSVFASEMEGIGKVAVKILNPNASHHTNISTSLLREVFSILASGNPAYSPAVGAIEDIKQWIDGDVKFTGFQTFDRQFKKHNDGYSIGGRYKIYVPKIFGPDNRFFSIEEYIEGTNLTNMDRLRSEGHDVKQIVKLLTKNFYEQIKSGLVHSDIHPGNIRVTTDGRVVYLDRNFYQQFSISERLFLANLSRHLNDAVKATETCLNYFSSQGGNIDREQKQNILNEVRELDSVTDATDKFVRVIATLRRNNIKLPLKVTLLVKDIFYLDRLAKKVGFSGIAEAGK